MCELFAMSSRHPATVTLSLSELLRHGGDTGPHADGWGIAYYEGGDARLVREPEPAAVSRCAALIEDLGLASKLVLTHIRKATHGGISLPNTQPFARELGGRLHVFAHNGELDGFEALPRMALGRQRPIGETDSERAFCNLLHRLEPVWLDSPGLPPLRERWEIVSRFAADIREFGPANFLYADGDVLFVHGHKRRQRPGGPMVPPGLHTLCRTCAADVDSPHEFGAPGVQVRSATDAAEQRVMLVASVPLTNEGWTPTPSGEVLVIRDGEIIQPAA